MSLVFDTTYTSSYTHNLITGNATNKIKKLADIVVHTPSHSPEWRPKLFAASIMDRMVLSEVNIGPITEEPSRQEAKVVFRLVVNEEMLNLANTVHGGALAYFVDFCSTIALGVLDPFHGVTVTQAMNIVFHSPASLDDTIRIVSRSVTTGGRSMSGKTEIWNETHRRLVVSGVQINMRASPPKSKL
ncbi:HotDog domain-containing protein [Rhodocollybia butyracea]|uniref:HotDog domain-containing protein n=1 Tax=Rhodocollybia butyracea TaxID=206335 RepID=A0A9P5U6B6_9AGAR|nr:HotDog domain-containing protein [Rhodocollybia butyracea]